LGRFQNESWLAAMPMVCLSWANALRSFSGSYHYATGCNRWHLRNRQQFDKHAGQQFLPENAVYNPDDIKKILSCLSESIIGFPLDIDFHGNQSGVY